MLHNGKVVLNAATAARDVKIDTSFVVILSGKSEQIVRSKIAAAARTITGSKPVHATDGVRIVSKASTVVWFIRGLLSAYLLRDGQRHDLRGVNRRACYGNAIREFASVGH